jgi:hypothetical protein
LTWGPLYWLEQLPFDIVVGVSKYDDKAKLIRDRFFISRDKYENSLVGAVEFRNWSFWDDPRNINKLPKLWRGHGLHWDMSSEEFESLLEPIPMRNYEKSDVDAKGYIIDFDLTQQHFYMVYNLKSNIIEDITITAIEEEF